MRSRTDVCVRVCLRVCVPVCVCVCVCPWKVAPPGGMLAAADSVRKCLAVSVCAGGPSAAPACPPPPWPPWPRTGTLRRTRACLQNLSAPFIMQVPPFKKTLMDSIPYMDFLFGNEVRATARLVCPWPACESGTARWPPRGSRCSPGPLWLAAALVLCGSLRPWSSVARCGPGPLWLAAALVLCGSR